MSVGRVIAEMQNLQRLLEPADFRKALAKFALSAPAIVSRRKLTPLDEAMSCDVAIRYRGARLVVPVGALDRHLRPLGDNASFGAIREMFRNDCYLRPFHPLRPMATVLDLGSNRGLFSLIAIKVLGAEKVVAVEPTVHYNDAFAMIASANGIGDGIVQRINAFMGTDGEGTISLQSLFAQTSIASIDFLKCDIEGGEYVTFSGCEEQLGSIANIAMELHPDRGDTKRLADTFRAPGMTVSVTDQFGAPAPASSGVYLYASREGRIECVS